MNPTFRLSALHKRSMTIVSLLLVLMLFASSASGVSAECAWTHRVRPGDTLGTIAHYYGTTVKDLTTINKISNPNLIFWGTNLCVSETTAPPAPFPNSYTVKRGDTLGYLAWRFGVSLGELAVTNGIGNVNLIFTGENLTVPPTPAPAS